MNWYVRYETGTIAGPMSEEEANDVVSRCSGGLMFNEEIFSPPQISVDVEELIEQLEKVLVGELREKTVSTLTALGEVRIVTGVIQGGVLELDVLPEGVEVDIRDRDCDGQDEDNLEEDARGSYFQAGQ